ncbi:MAG: hypothetical protein WD830_02740 [Chloroflexota bacterium]
MIASPIGGERPELVNRVEALPRFERDMDDGKLAALPAEGRQMSTDQATEFALTD